MFSFNGLLKNKTYLYRSNNREDNGPVSARNRGTEPARSDVRNASPAPQKGDRASIFKQTIRQH